MSTQAQWSADSGKTQCEIQFGKSTLVADLDTSAGGDGSHPSPHDLLEAALAACTTLTLQLYTKHKGWNPGTLRVEVSHAKGDGGAMVFTRRIHASGDITEEQRASLVRIANGCPVHKTLVGTIEIVTEAVKA